jgi:hypothetical protein
MVLGLIRRIACAPLVMLLALRALAMATPIVPHVLPRHSRLHLPHALLSVQRRTMRKAQCVHLAAPIVRPALMLPHAANVLRDGCF